MALSLCVEGSVWFYPWWLKVEIDNCFADSWAINSNSILYLCTKLHAVKCSYDDQVKKLNLIPEATDVLLAGKCLGMAEPVNFQYELELH